MMLRTSFAIVAFAGIGALIGFATLSEAQVTASQQQQQQQIMLPEQQQPHPPNINSNQSSVNSATEQGQNMTMTMTTEDGEIMTMTMAPTMTTNNQTFTTSSISLVNGVKVASISPIDNEHIAVNLSYDGKNERPPGVSVVALTNSSLTTIIDGIKQNSTITSADNSTLPIPSSMQSGSNYLEAGWQPQHPNSATVLVQLNGVIPDGEHVTVFVIPFLHH